MVIIRIAVIILAIFTAYAIYNYIVAPWILEPLCLINTNGCIRLAYYSYNNSALVHMRNTGYWLWFNGDKAYIYGQDVGQMCKYPNKFEAAYAINTHTGIKEGYECITTLNDLLAFYKDKNSEMKYLYKRVKNRKTFDVYGVLNILETEGIVNFS
jgi:hypothetical protein